MRKLCVYFKEEIREALFAMEPYDGICVRPHNRQKDKYRTWEECIKSGGCKQWMERLPAPQPKKRKKLKQYNP